MRFLTTWVGTILIAAALVGTAAGGGPPSQATGVGTLDTFTITSANQAGGNTILRAVATWTLAGTISGTAVEVVLWVIHSDGQFEYHATGTVTGSGGDCGVGTMPFRSDSKGTLDANRGKHVSIDQAHTSANIVMNLDTVGGADSFTYSGTYQCVS